MDTLVKKGCNNCLYLASHEKCGDYSDGTSCLGSCAEVDANNGEYLFRHWEEGTTKQAMDRLYKLEEKGDRNIVIGGMGEAEVNVKWTPEQTLKNLCYVSECCGYLTTKGTWTDNLKEIDILTHAHFRLVYIDNKLKKIKRVAS